MNLAEALAWKLDPHGSYGVAGFFRETGKQGKFNEFKVVDAPESAAARQQYTGQIGLITAAFHAAVPKGSAREVGTTLGREYDIQTPEYDDLEPGNLLAVVHIRYVDPKELEKTR